MGINSKQIKALAAKFERDVNDLRAIATAASITTASELESHLVSLAAEAAAEPDAGADAAVDNVQPSMAVASAAATAKGKPGRKPADPPPEWFVHSGLKPAQWKGWRRFLSENGPDDLATLMPGCTLSPQEVVGIWVSSGKGMNHKRLVKAIALKMGVTAPEPAAV